MLVASGGRDHHDGTGQALAAYTISYTRNVRLEQMFVLKNVRLEHNFNIVQNTVYCFISNCVILGILWCSCIACNIISNCGFLR